MEIVKSKCMWATHIHYLNDASEVQYALALLREAISKKTGALSEEGTILTQLNNYISSGFITEHGIFVAAFTEKGDLLSQWRGYCEAGKGVSIGFVPTYLMECGQARSFQLVQCIYDPEKQREIIQIVLNEILEQAKLKGPSPIKHPTQSYYEVFETYAEPLLSIVSVMKTPAFAEEQEWRLLSPVFQNYVEPPICYRAGKSWLVPYLEIPLIPESDKRAGIDRIFLGPTPHPSLSEASLGRYLSKQGITPLISLSRVPFRDW